MLFFYYFVGYNNGLDWESERVRIFRGVCFYKLWIFSLYVALLCSSCSTKRKKMGPSSVDHYLIYISFRFSYMDGSQCSSASATVIRWVARICLIGKVSESDTVLKRKLFHRYPSIKWRVRTDYPVDEMNELSHAGWGCSELCVSQLSLIGWYGPPSVRRSAGVRSCVLPRLRLSPVAPNLNLQYQESMAPSVVDFWFRRLGAKRKTWTSLSNFQALPVGY